MHYINIGKREPLSVKEEKELFNVIRRNPESKEAKEAKDQIILSNIGFVLTEARKHGIPGTCTEFDDLVNQGVEGLIHAFTKFKSEESFRFLTYASWWVQHYMQREVHAQGRTIALPLHRIAALSTIHNAIAFLSNAKKEITCKTIAKHTKIKVGVVAITLQMEKDGYFEWIRNIGTGHLTDCETQETENDHVCRCDLNKAIEHLTAKQREIVYRRVINGETFKEISNVMGVSKQRVEQIEKESFGKLREILS